MEFIDLPVEVQESILRKIPLQYATIINKNLHDATRIRYYNKFHLSQKQMKNYESLIPYVRIEEQSARTGEVYNATYNNTIMYGTSIIEGYDSDYVVVTSMEQKDVQESEYSIIWDQYKINYNLDLQSLYYSYPECPMIYNYKKNKIISILDSILQEVTYYDNRINIDIKENIEEDQVNYGLWHKVMQHYVYLFTSALALNLVNHDYFWLPFNGEKSEYIFARENVNGDNEENVKIYKNVLQSIYFLHNELYNYFKNL